MGFHGESAAGCLRWPLEGVDAWTVQGRMGVTGAFVGILAALLSVAVGGLASTLARHSQMSANIGHD
jgi:hypothetical protein